LKYRAEIDGLRALAVVPVILFHAGFELFSGGFVGVDVFFVISGYLITTILIEDIENKRFSIVNFYERRARRILPALYLVMVCTFIAGFILWSPYDLKNISQSIVATVLFSNNILLIKEGNDYFGALNSVWDVNPLIHTWSLAVEEQFYLIFPLVLLTLNYLKIKRNLLIFCVVTVCIFTYSLTSYSANEKFVFYATHTRAWQLLLGAACALAIFNNNRFLESSYASLLAITGLLFILISIFGLASIEMLGYWFYLLPTVGASLVILYTRSNNLVRILLSNNILVGIGLISYSLYLWHQPVFSFLSYKLVDAADANHSLSYGYILIALTLSFTLALFSYNLVEKPFRKGLRFSRKSVSFFLALVSLTLFIVGFLGHTTQGYRHWKISDDHDLYISYDDEKAKVKSSSWAQENNVGSDIGVIGDSASADLQQAFLSIGLTVDRYELDGTCFQIIVEDLACNDKSMDTLLDFVAGKDKILIASNMLTENSTKGYVALYNILKPYADVYVIGPFQFWKPTNVSFAAIKSELNVGEIFFKGIHTRITVVEDALRNGIENEHIISKFLLYCDMNNEICALYDGDKNPIFYDGIHHTVEGWRDYGLRLKEYFKANKISVN
jgi:peptidoglycan/LPS O-acetylase OafA/YrhL